MAPGCVDQPRAACSAGPVSVLDHGQSPGFPWYMSLAINPAAARPAKMPVVFEKIKKPILKCARRNQGL